MHKQIVLIEREALFWHLRPATNISMEAMIIILYTDENLLHGNTVSSHDAIRDEQYLCQIAGQISIMITTEATV